MRGRVGPPGVAYFGTTSRAGYYPQWGFDFPVVAGAYDLDTGSTTAELQEPMSAAAGWTSVFVPENALRATERQIATFSASRIGVGPKHQSYRRSSARDVRLGAPPSPALPEPLGPVTL